MWIEHYLAKYRPMSAALSAESIRQDLIVEFELEPAYAVIEREEDFATRATRWTFDPRSQADRRFAGSNT